MNKSFVDLLFILLCGTIVLLSQSLQIGAVQAEPAKLGGGGVSAVRAADTQLVTVAEDSLVLVNDHRAPRPLVSLDALADAVATEKCVLLVPATAAVTHHRVMQVWSECRRAGLAVKLAATATLQGTDTE